MAKGEPVGHLRDQLADLAEQFDALAERIGIGRNHRRIAASRLLFSGHAGSGTDTASSAGNTARAAAGSSAAAADYRTAFADTDPATRAAARADP